MTNNTRLFLIAAVLVCSCRGDASSDKRRLCDALAITAAALKDESLKHASEEYAAADRAMQQWEQWVAEQDRTGASSSTEERIRMHDDAWQRARTYARAGSAFCDAAYVQMWQLKELSALTEVRDVKDAAYRLFKENRFCSWHDLARAKERKVFLDEWQRRRSELEATARDVVDACFKKFGGTPPSVHTPGLWVPME